MELLYSAAVATGRLTLERFVELTARRPAELFGLYPQKGDLCPGGDADLVIFDPNARHTLSASTHHMNVDYSCFEGMALQGRCRTVILRGQVMVHEGRFVGPTTAGRYLCRLPHHY
jgi:dihydropyrimidinase